MNLANNSKNCKVVPAVCFWCGHSKKNICYFFMYPDAKKRSIESMIDSYNPCTVCFAAMTSGISVFEIEHSGKDTYPQFPELDSLSPTGRWFVFSEKYVKKIYGDPELIKNVLSTAKVFAFEKDYDQLFKIVEDLNGKCN